MLTSCRHKKLSFDQQKACIDIIYNGTAKNSLLMGSDYIVFKGGSVFTMVTVFSASYTLSRELKLNIVHQFESLGFLERDVLG